MLSTGNERMIFLLRNKLLRKDSRVKLKDDKFGEYLIKDIRIQNNKYYFLTQNTRSGQLKRVPQEYIISIDDMNIDRIIDAYNYDEEVKTIEIDFETDVITDLFGKEEGFIGDIYLEDGMKFILHKDKSPRLCNRILTVRIDDNGIKLIAPRGRPRKNS